MTKIEREFEAMESADLSADQREDWEEAKSFVAETFPGTSKFEKFALQRYGFNRQHRGTTRLMNALNDR